MYLSEFDEALWLKVKQARRSQDLWVQDPVELPDHPLQGTWWQCYVSGERWQVAAVHRDWLQGYYLQATLRSNRGGTRVAVVEALDSRSAAVQREARVFSQIFVREPALA